MQWCHRAAPSFSDAAGSTSGSLGRSAPLSSRLISLNLALARARLETLANLLKQWPPALGRKVKSIARAAHKAQNVHTVVYKHVYNVATLL